MMSGRAATTRRPISFMPPTTRRARSSTPVGDIRMCEVAKAPAILPISVPPDLVGIGADGNLPGHRRIARQHVVHLQDWMDAKRGERLWAAVGERLALVLGKAVFVEYRTLVGAQPLEQPGHFEQALDQAMDAVRRHGSSLGLRRPVVRDATAAGCR